MANEIACGVPKIEGPSIARDVGWADFYRHGARLIIEARDSLTVFSITMSSGERHMLMRPVSKCKAIADQIPEACKVTFQEFKQNVHQFRALVMVGFKFRVRTGPGAVAVGREVVVERHPDCPSEIVEAHMRRMRTDAAGRMNNVTRLHAKRADEGTATIGRELQNATETIIREVRNLTAAQETCTAVQGEVRQLLDKLLEQGVLRPDQAKLLKRLAIREGVEIAIEDARPFNATHLERTGG